MTAGEVQSRIHHLLAAWRTYADRDDEGVPFAEALAGSWRAFAGLASPAAVGARAVVDELLVAWLVAEQVPWRARVALLTTGVHDWSASLRALAALTPVPTTAYDDRETWWSALFETAPGVDRVEEALAQAGPAIGAGTLGTRLHGSAAKRLAALGAPARAVEEARKVRWPETRARTLGALAPGLDPATLRAEVDLAWASVPEAPMPEEHFRLLAYQRLLRLDPSPARAIALEGFVASLPEPDLAVCPDHDDARAILAEGWAAVGDAERASAWRARLPVEVEDEAPPDEAAEPEPEDLLDQLPTLPVDALDAVLDGAAEAAVRGTFFERSAAREALAAVAARPDLPALLTSRARTLHHLHWDLDDELPDDLPGPAQAELLRRALRRRRRSAWRRDRWPHPNRQAMVTANGPEALATWRLLDTLDPPAATEQGTVRGPGRRDPSEDA
jgi:hypothetical protein